MYVIKRDSDFLYLCRIVVGAHPFSSPLGWTDIGSYAIHFSSKDEVKSTIKFLVDVIDAELDGDLRFVRVPV